MEGVAHAWGSRWWERNISKIRMFEQFQGDFFNRTDRNWNESFNV